MARRCSSCGRENPEDARFCSACGTALAGEEPLRERRKVVTVLFCDLVGSTALGEATDPEALRARMRRYFGEARAVLERHGGSVEKFVGDAVMAVFGIPTAHENDALRAVRAAWELRDAVARHGLEVRIGVNTGEAVAGDEGETLVTGDAVNVAARLEQAADPGTVLLGPETRLLVRDAVRAEPVEPLALRGKSQPVEAFRLVEVRSDAEAIARRLGTRLVGRRRERERLWRDYEDAIADPTCHLFTLLGPAGIGKSRLVADFLERVGDSTDVLRGRCLHYGEGITYWPLVEILLAIGVDPASVIGTSPAETQLAFRRLLEARAEERPQIVVLEDLQWAEPTFLDLVEHVADLSRGVPIFLLCVARTELLDTRPGWGGGKLNATSLLLEPLAEEERDTLIDELLGDATLDDELRERIARASEGNPLFVEEMLAMVRERGGNSEVVVPPTIHALLQARIDSLERDVRAVIERGAVEGEVFHRGAVAALAPERLRPDLGAHLTTLVRKELIRATKPTLPQDEGFRFRHLLIRDAVYEALPKATRAELHERFADWLATKELLERDEVVGYHLEQAHRYRAELDPDHPLLSELAVRAAEHLGAAGRGALDRGDFNAGRTLLGRARALLPARDERRLALAPELAAALRESGDSSAREVLEEALESGDRITRARVALTLAVVELSGGSGIAPEQREAWREAARAVLEEERNEHGLALYWWSVAMEAWFRCRAQETADACERSLAHLARSEDPDARLGRPVRGRLIGSYTFSPIPVDEAIERVHAVRAGEGGLLAKAWERTVIGRLLAMKGDFESAREHIRGARQAYVDVGMLQSAGGLTMSEGSVEWRAGDLAAAERLLREGLELLERIGDRSYFPTAALSLARVLYEQGRDDEVRHWCERARATTSESDLVNFVLLDSLEGCLLAHAGRLDEGEEQAQQGVATADTTDFVELRATSRASLAEALVLAGRHAEALRHGEEAVTMLDAKGDVALAARLRDRLATVGAQVG